MECKGVLFDLDGTLVDSLVVVERTWANWAIMHQLDPEAVINYIHGKQAITSLRHFLPEASEEELQKEFRYLEQVEATEVDGIIALPGAKALLLRLNELNIPWAIVTSGTDSIAKVRLAAGELPMPAVFITAEYVSRGKPEPDAYLLGAEKLGLHPYECVVFEDAPAGIASGLAAGCQVIAVNAPANTANLDRVAKQLTTLAGIRVDYQDGKVKFSFE